MSWLAKPRVDQDVNARSYVKLSRRSSLKESHELAAMIKKTSAMNLSKLIEIKGFIQVA